ncbi:sigma-54-dependent transcriptional regulator [Actomonas aquatica]|uniref:Response regulator n=1 Tax=Actomonas aquatica TaxID=2866162 RepID=A0ABZ1C5K6_9BACT|nr:response regulator [Opitutus sp. WL0086]WRQ86513.1 response regulator [Opitutus sp. WL0086]
MANILVVEDDRATGQLMLTLAESMGHTSALASDGESALRLVRESQPDMIISDVLMEPMDGLELLEIVRREFPAVAVVLFSASRDPEVQVRALRLGSVQFLAKPLRIEQLKKVLEKTLADRASAAADSATTSATLKAPVREITVEGLEEALRPYLPGPRLRDQRFRLARLAKVRNRVLVEAAEGVFNTDMLALLHRHSHRAAGPLEVINFANCELDNLTAEWTQNAHAWLQRFSGGTLVFLQIEKLPLHAQGLLADLVRRVQDVRIVATTRRDPDQLLAEGSLNESLYFRLSLFSMRVPPVSELGSDITEVLLDAVCASSSYNLAGRPDYEGAAREALAAYSWPRNYSELHQVADYIAARLKQPRISLAELPESVAAARWPSLGEHVKEALKLHVDRVVRTTSDAARAAAVLGVPESLLRAHLEEPNDALLAALVEPTSRPSLQAITPSYERILIVSSDDLWRTSAVAMAVRPDRLVLGVPDALAAVSTLLNAPESFDHVLIAPPLDVFSPGEIGRQFRRICPGTTLGLLEAFPEPEDCEPFHEIFDRPDDGDRLERLLGLMRDYREKHSDGRSG